MDTSFYADPTLNIYGQIAARTLIISRLAGVLFQMESDLKLHRITENKESHNPVITQIGDTDYVTGYFVDTEFYPSLNHPLFEKWATEQLMVESSRLKTPFEHIDIMFMPGNIRLAIVLKEPLHKSLIKA